jgi:hypothetical protein
MKVLPRYEWDENSGLPEMAVPFGTVPAQSGDYERRSGNLAKSTPYAVLPFPLTIRRPTPVCERADVTKTGIISVENFLIGK